MLSQSRGFRQLKLHLLVVCLVAGIVNSSQAIPGVIYQNEFRDRGSADEWLTWWNKFEFLPHDGFLVLNLDGHESALAKAIAGLSNATVISLSGKEEILLQREDTCNHIHTAVYPSQEVLKSLLDSPELFDVVLCLRCLMIDAKSSDDLVRRAALISSLGRHSIVYLPSFLSEISSKAISIAAERLGGAHIRILEPTVPHFVSYGSQYCTTTKSKLVPDERYCCSTRQVPTSPRADGRLVVSSVKKANRVVKHHYGARDTEYHGNPLWNALQGAPQGKNYPKREYNLSYTQQRAALTNMATGKEIVYRGRLGITLNTLLALGLTEKVRFMLYKTFVNMKVYGDMAPWNLVYRAGCTLSFIDHDAEEEDGASSLYSLTAALLLHCHGRMEFDFFSDGVTTACAHEDACGSPSIEDFLTRSFSALNRCMAGSAKHSCEGKIVCGDGSCANTPLECFRSLASEEVFFQIGLPSTGRHALNSPGTFNDGLAYHCYDTCTSPCVPEYLGNIVRPVVEASSEPSGQANFAECLVSCVSNDNSTAVCIS